MIHVKRELRSSKSDQKLEALSLWKNGAAISEIAKQVRVARSTIYRWVEESDKKLIKRTRKKNNKLSKADQIRIVEHYFILRKPSMRFMSDYLLKEFNFKIDPQKIYRLLKEKDLLSPEQK